MYTSQYFEKEGAKNDYRSLVDVKKSSVIETAPYIQVFENKHEYLPNLSILDLLFNLGPEALPYLLNHSKVES